MVKVIIPAPLRGLTGDAGEVEAEGRTLKDVIDDLDRRHPGIKDRICQEDGEIRRFINVYIDKEDFRFLNGLATPIPEGAEISILPAIAGGAGLF